MTHGRSTMRPTLPSATRFAGGRGFIVGQRGQKPLPLRVAQLPGCLELVVVCVFIDRHKLIREAIGTISSVLGTLSLRSC